MGAIDKHIVEANVKLLDENNVLKDDKKILNLRVEEKDKVINDLLSRIATLEYEVERLHYIIKELEKDLEKERKIDRPRDDYNYGLTNALDYAWYKLQELKGSDKE